MGPGHIRNEDEIDGLYEKNNFSKPSIFYGKSNKNYLTYDLEFIFSSSSIVLNSVKC